jgi:hypothetical protein
VNLGYLSGDLQIESFVIAIEVRTDHIDYPASPLTRFYAAGHRVSLATFRPTELITCQRLRYTDIWVEVADSRFGDALLTGGRGIYIYTNIKPDENQIGDVGADGGPGRGAQNGG